MLIADAVGHTNESISKLVHKGLDSFTQGALKAMDENDDSDAQDVDFEERGRLCESGIEQGRHATDEPS
ncbi:hypothetical protein BGZ54_001803 [Gamsiella multidivaricata]|nr:hypothetical protein BGZ54_001803 [Gamsiella multidivaricata]